MNVSSIQYLSIYVQSSANSAILQCLSICCSSTTRKLIACFVTEREYTFSSMVPCTEIMYSFNNSIRLRCKTYHCNQPINIAIFFLSQTENTKDILLIVRWIPGCVQYYDSIGSNQVYSLSASLSRDKEYARSSVRFTVEPLYHFMPNIFWGFTIQSIIILTTDPSTCRFNVRRYI